MLASLVAAQVQMLKHKLRELERGSGNAASGYQQQVTTLQDELHRIKHVSRGAERPPEEVYLGTRHSA